VPRSDETSVPALDGLRGLAILLVLVFHFDLHCPGIVRAHAPLVDRIAWKLAETGWVGVDLFFVLSGFLITGVLQRSKTHARYYGNFYARRALRIFPLHYIVLVAALVAVPAMRVDAVWYACFASNLKIATTGFGAHAVLGHFWSLAVEVQLYLLWPIAVRALDQRKLAWLCALVIILAVIVRCALVLANHSTAAYVLTVARMDAFAVGALVSLAPPLFTKERFVKVGAAAAAALVMVVLWRRRLYLYDDVVVTLGYSLVALAFGSLLGIAVHGRAGLLSGRALRFFGRYSYALYVVHYPLLFLLPQNGGGMFRVFGSQLPGELLFMVIAVLVCVVLALVSWHVCEKHALALKKSAFQ
jgi:peptidoglycan/LPS O-acetylase OafA/YrhL